MSKGEVIEGIKLIYHNMAGVNEPDDPSYPFVLDINLRGPEFMEVFVAFTWPEGETIKIRGMTREKLEEFVERNHFLTHCRLRRLSISGPDGVKVLK